MGERDAFLHRDTLYRGKGHDVDGADARMSALVGVHVDMLQRDFRRFEERILDRRGNADKADDETVVVFVGTVVKKVNAALAFKAIHDLIYYILSSAFAEIWYAFDQLHCHNLFLPFNILLDAANLRQVQCTASRTVVSSDEPAMCQYCVNITSICVYGSHAGPPCAYRGTAAWNAKAFVPRDFVWSGTG